MQRCLHEEEVTPIFGKNMDLKNLEKALTSFMDEDIPVSIYGRVGMGEDAGSDSVH